MASEMLKFLHACSDDDDRNLGHSTISDVRSPSPPRPVLPSPVKIPPHLLVVIPVNPTMTMTVQIEFGTR